MIPSLILISLSSPFSFVFVWLRFHLFAFWLVWCFFGCCVSFVEQLYQDLAQWKHKNAPES